MPSVLKNTKRESILYGCVIVANAEKVAFCYPFMYL